MVSITMLVFTLCSCVCCIHIRVELGENIGDDELMEMIREADTDHDDGVTSQDFVRVMQRGSKFQ